MPRKVNRNPGVAKRGDKWKARAFFDGREVSKTFSTQDEALKYVLTEKKTAGDVPDAPFKDTWYQLGIA